MKKIREAWDYYNKDRLSPFRMNELPNKEHFWIHYYTHYAYEMLHNTVISILQFIKYAYF